MNYIEYNKDPRKNSIGLTNQEIQYFNTKNENEKKNRERSIKKGLEIQQSENSGLLLLKDEPLPDFDTEINTMEDDMTNNGFVQLKHCSKDFWDTTTKVGKKEWDLAKKEAKVGETMLKGLVAMMTTPEGLLVFGEIIGFNIAVDLTTTLIYQAISRVLEKIGVKAASSAAELVADKVICTSASNLIKAARWAVEGTEFAAELGAEGVIAAACPPCAAVEAVLFWVQIIGMLLDILDPFHCSDGAATVESLNASTLEDTIIGYNTVFKDSILASGVGQLKLANGDVISNKSIWPIQFPGINLFDRDLILPHSDTLLGIGLCTQDQIDDPNVVRTWDDISVYYQCQYLQTLKMNSSGLLCNIPLSFNSSDVINFSNVTLKYQGKIAMAVANNNPDIANWIYKWWPIIILILIIIIFGIIKLLL